MEKLDKNGIYVIFTRLTSLLTEKNRRPPLYSFEAINIVLESGQWMEEVKK